MKKGHHITTLWINTKDWEKANLIAFEIALHQDVDNENKELNLYKELRDRYFMNCVFDLLPHNFGIGEFLCNY